jgi:hypothetical protein
MGAIIDLTYDKVSVNPARLREELAAVLGSQFVGLSTGPDSQVRVHIQDSMKQADRDKIGPIVAAHDANQLTAAQQAEMDRAAALETLRKPWAEWTPEDQAQFLKILAAQAGLIA